jgi:GAF domain-containing protein
MSYILAFMLQDSLYRYWLIIHMVTILKKYLVILHNLEDCLTCYSACTMLYSAEVPSREAIAKAVHDESRLATVRAVDAVEQRRHPIFDDLSRQASRLLDVPLALISLVEEDRDIIYGQYGLAAATCDVGYIDAQPSFCQLTITSEKPVVITDAQQVPTLRLFPSVVSLGVRAHLGIPLRVDGQPIGNCCVIDFRPREWTASDVAHLSELAAAAIAQFTTHRAPTSSPR